MYRPFNIPIESIGEVIVIEQQWLLLQEQKINVHPQQAEITGIIDSIKKK